MAQLSRIRIVLLGLAILIILLSWALVLSAQQGLISETLDRDGVPLRFIAPAGTQDRPGILIAHGFGGSQQIMLGYAYTLAHAGYATMLWDFAGHGANGTPLSREGSILQQNLNVAYAELAARPEVDPNQLGLLGHSMGSGAVMMAGILNPQRYHAIVAISPVTAEVTPFVPPNLMLQAGELEPQFAATGRSLLADAGGKSNTFETGRARTFAEIPGVEHISILFSPQSHRVSLSWLNAAFSRTNSTVYVDLRIFWYLLHLAGWLVGIFALAPILRKTERRPAAGRHRLLGLLLAPIAATGLLALTNLVVDVGRLWGLFVGGGFALWAFYFGLTWLLVAPRPPLPSLRDIAWGFVLFAILWVAFGALAQFVWLPWFLIPIRLLRWPLLTLLFLPWMWAAGLAQAGTTPGRRLSWWLGETLLFLLGLLATMQVVPAMGVLILVLPLLPFLSAIMAFAAAAIDRPGTYAIGNAMFFAWLVLAYFPLS